MEQDTSPESVASPPPGAAAKSKLDTLSKDDLIKFAKKQMAAIQKMKSKCADLEKEVDNLKSQPKGNSGDSIIQELTERMSALLLEKAETQQSAVLLRKENEKVKQREQDAVGKLATLLGELDQTKEDHQKKIAALEKSLDSSQAKHKEEVEFFQRLLRKKEENDREKESEREQEKQREKEHSNESVEAISRSLESQILSLQTELAAALERSAQVASAMQEDHQRALTEVSSKAQQEVENLREELAQHSVQHEEELRALEEDFEMERERLLLLQEELSEQLALKDSFLQDVQEEEEEPSGRSSGIARMLELSGVSQINASDGETESGQLRSALEDQQSQNTMLQDELTFLGNVKTELEAELERVREEFQTEKEELQFKIEELLMTREVATPNRDLQEAQAFTQLQQSGPQRDSVDGLPASPASPSSPRQSLSSPVPGAAHQSLTLQEKQGQAQELRSQCESLDRSQAVAEYEHTRDILRGLETELGQRTGDFTRQYEAMKEQAASAVQELQESVRGLTEERDGLVERVKGLDEDRESLLEKVQGLEKRLESFLEQTQAAKGLKKQLQMSMEEKTALALKLKDSVEAQTVFASELKASLEVQTVLAVELRASVEDLSKQNGEILSQLQMKESAVQELEETVNVVSTARDRTLSALQDREMEVMRLWEEREREVEESQGQRGEVAELQARIEELEKERSLLKSNLEEVQRERSENVQGSPGEELEELQARIEELEKERSLLKSNLGEVVGDTEALQKDLREMKLANEKMRTENQELLTQVSQATETLSDREREEKEGRETEREEEEEQAEKERRELQQQLTEKDTVISQLRSEMAGLQSTAPSLVSEENTANEFTEKIALLEKESKGKDERMNKIKAVAVKARKELDTSRKEAVSLKEEVEVLKAERERVTSSMKDIIHGAEGYKNLQLDYDRQTEQLDKERETVEGAEKQISELTKRLNTAVQQHEQLWSEREDLMTELETLRSTVRQMEGQTAELHRQTDTLNRDLQAERLLKEQKTKELSSLQKEVEELTVQLRRQKQQSQQTTQELEQLRKEAQQSSLLDMEMADYERLVKELNTKLSEKDVCVEELKTQIHTHTQEEEALNQEIEVLKSQLDQGEDKSSKMKQLLVKTKKDLADAKRQEAIQMMTLASLKGELEAHQQQLENNKIQCCDLTAERHRLHEQLRTLTEQQQRTSSSLQQRLTTLQQEANTAKAELSSVTAEFDSYKVRVHNVLKQQKNKTSAQSDGDATKQEREQMESMVDQYKAKLQDSQQSLAVSTAEFQQLQMEHDTLLERHNKILQETVAKEAELRERLMSLQAEIMSLRTEHAQTVGQLTSQAVAQRSGFREQIRHLQDEHRTTVETLQNQMTRLENQLFTLQKQTSPAPVQTSRKSAVDRRPVDQGGMGGLGLGDLQSMAREEGEGMETSETESLSSTYLPSLEQLLTSPDPKQEPFVWQVEPTKEELNQKLTTATRSMEHMNSLLHETEATNAVLMEQVNLLKSEVRRLERNHEREKSVANLEYLKNVLLQFIFLQSGSERQALLPVIHTMLQLSPEEKNKLAAIAMGEEEVGGARGSGWTSYLHSWSGIR
ncbi:GRIP and coiled-coil domain-containing protein 2-like isoform X1 [Salvelinus namaycush]|uniref:GRIP and coiled-coil domain-containing protein 2-like isoform X1 n=1 Tax=Salvelinus namaycush TaxID=8040 RepID=A0A8U1C7Z5_SALNM|nr:GRIP and coiled-coil domain-containing protein 2-like isoform X1 [Salvelinus namaycush]